MREVALMRMLELFLGQVQVVCLQMTPTEGLGIRWQGKGGCQVREGYCLSSRRVRVRQSRVSREREEAPELGRRGRKWGWLGLCRCHQNQTRSPQGDCGKASGWGWKGRGQSGQGWGSAGPGWEEEGVECGEKERGPQ